MSVLEASLWLVGYIFFELMVWGGVWYFFAKIIRRGPDMESPVLQNGHQPDALEAHSHNPHAAPSYIRPI
jgi:cytochrome d ubiquinol oxidase subunit I